MVCCDVLWCDVGGGCRVGSSKDHANLTELVIESKMRYYRQLATGSVVDPVLAAHPSAAKLLSPTATKLIKSRERRHVETAKNLNTMRNFMKKIKGGAEG